MNFKSIKLCLILILYTLSFINSEENIIVEPSLLVFKNHKASNASKHFDEIALPKIKEIAEKENISFTVLTSENGIPADITTLPAIVFINNNGRSVYQGRYMTFERIQNFIETSKNIGQVEVPAIFKNVPSKKIGRMNLTLPLKICDVTGNKPKEHDYSKFSEDALKSILSELKDYKMQSELKYLRTDRFFYLDFYPWVSENGELYLSGAVFSQYHCKKPVWTTLKEPFIGSYRDRDKLFKKITIKMLEVIKDVSENSKIGDSFDAISSETAELTWKTLGYQETTKENRVISSVKAEIGNSWQVNSELGDKATVQFRLAPPNENYSGFAKHISGNINFIKEDKAFKMLGKFTVKTNSITMGEPELDSMLPTKEMLDVKNFPISEFVFDIPLDSNSFQIYYGKENIIDVPGKFKFKGKDIDITPEVSLEAINKNSKMILLAKANFRFDLKLFGLTGASDNTPEKDVIELFITLELHP